MRAGGLPVRNNPISAPRFYFESSEDIIRRRIYEIYNPGSPVEDIFEPSPRMRLKKKRNKTDENLVYDDKKVLKEYFDAMAKESRQLTRVVKSSLSLRALSSAASPDYFSGVDNGTADADGNGDGNGPNTIVNNAVKSQQHRLERFYASKLKLASAPKTFDRVQSQGNNEISDRPIITSSTSAELKLLLKTQEPVKKALLNVSKSTPKWHSTASDGRPLVVNAYTKTIQSSAMK
jgi:hypothetical protein